MKMEREIHNKVDERVDADGYVDGCNKMNEPG